MFAVCYNCGTRHTGTFAVCVSFAMCQEARHTANMGFDVCWVLCRVLPFRHTAKAMFAVCPIYDTRQSFRHTATGGFPVVTAVAVVHIFTGVVAARFLDNGSEELGIDGTHAAACGVPIDQSCPMPTHGEYE